MKKTGITIVAALALLAPFAKADVIGPGITTFAGGGLIILAGAAAVILIVAIIAIKLLRWYNANK